MVTDEKWVLIPPCIDYAPSSSPSSNYPPPLPSGGTYPPSAGSSAPSFQYPQVNAAVPGYPPASSSAYPPPAYSPQAPAPGAYPPMPGYAPAPGPYPPMPQGYPAQAVMAPPPGAVVTTTITSVFPGADRLKWVAARRRAPTTSYGVGKDLHGSTLYVARAIINGSMIVGKAGPHLTDGGHFPTNGVEAILPDYEVMHATKGVGWMTWNTRNPLPPNAICAGMGPDGQPVYIGRGNIRSTLTPGTLRPQVGISIAYGGKEHILPSGEVLVAK